MKRHHPPRAAGIHTPREEETLESVHPRELSLNPQGASIVRLPVTQRALDPALVGARSILWQRFELLDRAEVSLVEADGTRPARRGRTITPAGHGPPESRRRDPRREASHLRGAGAGP